MRRFRLKQWWLALGCTLVLAACGGGGGSPPLTAGGVWDTGTWDNATWGP